MKFLKGALILLMSLGFACTPVLSDECDRDADCADGESCSSGECVSNDGANNSTNNNTSNNTSNTNSTNSSGSTCCINGAFYQCPSDGTASCAFGDTTGCTRDASQDATCGGGGVDLGDAGEACEDSWDCDGGACFYKGDEGYCTLECTSDAGCPTDWECLNRAGGMYCVQP